MYIPCVAQLLILIIIYAREARHFTAAGPGGRSTMPKVEMNGKLVFYDCTMHAPSNYLSGPLPLRNASLHERAGYAHCICIWILRVCTVNAMFV